MLNSAPGFRHCPAARRPEPSGRAKGCRERLSRKAGQLGAVRDHVGHDGVVWTLVMADHGLGSSFEQSCFDAGEVDGGPALLGRSVLVSPDHSGLDNADDVSAGEEAGCQFVDLAGGCG